ncbi:SGNH hydrolase-type esterase domain [Trypanosoma melophagium]|uniref:SGNH hydrolase-type esterase domain n=1 Tax=Trypanosoma melophagium TaxID=715481 RepID=UPI00351A01CC|nr:SGNH hydrolase-type esterase domain [Trypanosoma melophagium]
MRHIILLGDSLTQEGYFSGWVSRLSNCYIRRADVLNRGLSGYNSRWILDILVDDTRRQHLLPSQLGRPLFITLMVGSNDAAVTAHHVPLQEFKGNLKRIIDLVREHAAPVGGIFLLTPPPIDEEARLKRIQGYRPEATVADRSLETVRQYRDAVIQVGSEEEEAHGDVTVIDLFWVFLGDSADTMPYSKGPWCDYFSDGLHFNEAGGKLLFEALWDGIGKSSNAKGILPDGLPFMMPPHETLWLRE